MNMENSDDLAIETLLAVSAQLAPDIEIDLLKRCYAIQKAHQFSLDRSQSAQAMDRLIEERVNTLLSADCVSACKIDPYGGVIGTQF